MMLGVYLRPFLPELGLVFLGCFIINLLYLVAPWYMIQVSDKVFVYHSMESLLFLTLILIWLFIVMGILEYVRSRITTIISLRIESNFYPKIYDSLLVRSSKGHIEQPDHVMADLTNLKTFLGSESIFGLLDLIWVPVFLVILFLFSWKLGVFAIVMAIISFLISLAINRFANVDYERGYELAFQASDELITQLKNVDVIRSMGMQERVRQRWLQKHFASEALFFQSNEKMALWYSLSKNFRYISITMMMAAGTFLLIENEMTIGMMMASGLLLGRVIMPVDMLGSSLKQITHLRFSIKRLKALFEHSNDFPRDNRQVDLNQGLCVEDVTVRLPDSQRDLLKDISFSMPAASCLVILGDNGAGKTTLIRTLTGLVQLTTGKIGFAGIDLRHLSAEQVGYVSQGVFLVDGSIADNICRFGERNDEKMLVAAQLVGIHDFIMSLHEGYESLIGDGLLVLSGGQRQLIALARAVYDMPAIVVLDEPNSSLDEHAERSLVSLIAELKVKGSTVIISTHHYSVLPLADYVLMLEAGRVSVFARREDLINQQVNPLQGNSD
jgi:PrtD family type I secretion system ABC transporter